VIEQLAKLCCDRAWLDSHMVGKLLNPGRLRSIMTVIYCRARAIRSRYLEAGCTPAEKRAINVLKEWLSPEQLAQYESHRYFDVIGEQSGKRYRIRYGTSMNVCQIDSRGRMVEGLCFAPNEILVAGDIMLTQKIAFESDEWNVLAVARTFRPTWH